MLSDSYKEKFKGEIEQIEILCRLNIAACKLKLKEYELVIRECNKINKKKEHWKAYYRAGIAYYEKENYQNALTYFEKSKELNKEGTDQTLDNYIKESRQKVRLLNKEESKQKEVKPTNEDLKINEKHKEVINNEEKKQNEEINPSNEKKKEQDKKKMKIEQKKKKK